MSSLRRKGLVAAMEDGELGGEASGELAPVEMLEIDDAGITGDSAAIEDDSSLIAETQDDAEVLQDVQDVATDAEAEGGLSPDAAEMAEVITEHIGRKLGIRTRIMPSMESFGSANSRKAATKLAIENIGEQIARIWQVIKDAIVNLWKKIVAFVKKLFNGNLALEKAAKALKDRVKTLKGTVKEDTFEDGSISSNFGTETVNEAKVSEVLGLHVGYCARAGALESIIAASATSLDALAESMGKGVTVNSGKSDKAILGAFEKLADFMAPGSPSEFKEFTYPTDAKQWLVKGDVVKLEADWEKNEDGVEEVTLTYSFDKADGFSETGKKVDTLSIGSMNSICDKVIELSKANDKLSKSIDAASKKTNDLVKAIDKIVQKAKENEKKGNENASKETRSDMNMLKKSVNMVSRLTGSFSTAIASKNITAGKAALGYVSKSCSKYNAK